MATDLVTELQQTKPFRSMAEEAHVSIARTEAVLQEGFDRLLKPFGLTSAQYNVLRILRGNAQGGASGSGLCRNEVRDRMVSRMPDVTRLLDRMEEAGLIRRERSTTDRRLVATHLTERGREIVDSLDAPIAEEHQRRMGHMSEAELSELLRLLALVRQGR